MSRSIAKHTSLHSFAKNWRKISVYLTKRKGQIIARRMGVPAHTSDTGIPASL